MKKFICTAIICILVLSCNTGLIFTPAYAADSWTVGDGRVTEEVKAIVVENAEVDMFIKTGTENAILITETSAKELSEDQQVHWRLDGTTLRIKYENSFWNIFEFLLGDTQRSLTITVPEDLVLNSLEVNVASANVITDTLHAVSASFDSSSGDMDIALDGVMEKTSFDTASGNVTASLANSKEVRADASSGDIAITLKTAQTVKADASSGNITISLDSAEKIEADTSSGDITISLDSTQTLKTDTASGDVTISMKKADQADIDTASGDVTMTLPADADITLNVSTASGDFTTEIPMTTNGKTHVLGDGSGQVKISTASGDINILQEKS